MTLTRRALLRTGGAAGLAAATAGAGFAVGRETDASGTPDHVVAFPGPHQAGIATAAQDRLHFAALDVEPGVTRADLRDLMARWTAASRRLTLGLDVGAGASSAALAPPDDTGEAVGLSAAN